MLWSPSEVLAFIKDEEVVGNHDNIERDEKARLVPTSAFGGFPLWPADKEDFIFIAENSELIGPNPLFTIPELGSEVDLDLLATKILSADFQGLGNNKTLPSLNTQLLMPDIEDDVHVAANHFFLFDSEARGFVRPMCIAYFTSDKHKLIKCSDRILKNLEIASSILQQSNISTHTQCLNALKENVSSSDAQGIEDSIIKSRLQDIQEILDFINAYKGNELFDKRLTDITKMLKKSNSSELVTKLLAFWPTADSLHQQADLNSSANVFRPNVKKYMRNLYTICGKGFILTLYHLYITHKHFRRKYESIGVTEFVSGLKCKNLLYGACVRQPIRSSSDLFQSTDDCCLKAYTATRTLSLENEGYFDCFDDNIEKALLRFINGDKVFMNVLNQLAPVASSPEVPICEPGNYVGAENTSVFESKIQSHISSLDEMPDTFFFVKKQYAGIESSFLKVLKLFYDTKRLLFAVLTRTPIVVISSPQELLTAENFITALSVFIPRTKSETLFVDTNRQEPLEKEHMKRFAAVNFCLFGDHGIEKLIPVEIVPSLCILNLKDCSLTAPLYTGCLLADIDERLRILTSDGPAFMIIMSLFEEIESATRWWMKVTSPDVSSDAASKFVLKKGYSRCDVLIMEKLSAMLRL